MSNKPFHYQDPFPLSKDQTEYYLLTRDHVSVSEFEGQEILKVDPQALTLLAQHAFHRGMQQHPGIIDRHDNTDQWGLLHTVHLPLGLYSISILMLTFYVSVQRTPCRMAAARQTGAAMERRPRRTRLAPART